MLIPNCRKRTDHTLDGNDTVSYIDIDDSGISTIIMDTLGIEVRGENMDCTISTQVYPRNWMISLDAEEASKTTYYPNRKRDTPDSCWGLLSLRVTFLFLIHNSVIPFPPPMCYNLVI